MPRRIALLLTLPEHVTAQNIEELTRRVVRGSGDVNGAEYITTTSGVTIHLEHCAQRAKIRLQYGWVVERYLKDDDIVVFNRRAHVLLCCGFAVVSSPLPPRSHHDALPQLPTRTTARVCPFV